MLVTPNVARPDQLIHCYSFRDPRILGETNSYKDSWGDPHKTILGARKKHPEKACQMTITNQQLTAYEHSDDIITYLTTNGFKTVSTHVNPNTYRRIHTFMAPPIGVKKKERQKPPYLPCQGLGVFSHSGGCCGVGEVVGLKFDIHNSTTIKKNLSETLGDVFYSGSIKSLTQVVVDSNDWNPLKVDMAYYLSRIGFKELFSWTNPDTHKKFKLIGFSTSFKDTPTNLQF